MADQPNDPTRAQTPANQTGEGQGSIKRPQQTDATMAEKDLPRGSEPEAHARRG